MPLEGGAVAPAPVTPDADAGDNTTAKPDDLPVLRKGAKGDAVRKLQRLLNEMLAGVKGYVPLEIDGDFGKLTRAAVRKYQSMLNDVYGRPLVVDGIVGVLTWGALLA